MFIATLLARAPNWKQPEGLTKGELIKQTGVQLYTEMLFSN
jgi:hypothetical protein